MSAKHTPGPWRIGSVETKTRGIDIMDANDRFVCHVPLPRYVDQSSARANAQLLRSAPEMLEALRAADAAIKYAVAAANSETDYEKLCAIQDQARAAIAKAEGREP